MNFTENIYLYYLPTGITELSQRGQIFSLKNALSKSICGLPINASTHNIDKEAIAYKAIEIEIFRTIKQNPIKLNT